MSWVSGHFVCGGGRTWTGYGTWDAGPQGHHLLSLQLPFAKHRGRGKYSPLRPSTGKRKILQGGLTDVRTLTHYWWEGVWGRGIGPEDLLPGDRMTGARAPLHHAGAPSFWNEHSNSWMTDLNPFTGDPACFEAIRNTLNSSYTLSSCAFLLLRTHNMIISLWIIPYVKGSYLLNLITFANFLLYVT